MFLLTVAICAGAMASWVQAQDNKALPMLKPCVADVGVIMDGSYSVGGDDGTGETGRAWKLEKRFVKDIANTFIISSRGVHMSVVVFSEKATLNIKFNQFSDSDSFGTFLDTLGSQSQTTRIDLALSLSEKDMFAAKNGARLGVPKVLLLLTDGSQTDRNLNATLVNPLPIAKRIRESGVRIIAVGIPDLNGDVDKEEMIGITGQEQYVHITDAFATIQTQEFLNSIVSQSCESSILPTTTAMVTTEAPFTAPPSCKGWIADIGFIIDASYSIGGDDGTGEDGKAWQLEKRFVKEIAKGMKVSSNGVHAALIVFSESAALRIKLDQYTDSDSFGAAVDNALYEGSITRIDLALRLAETAMFIAANGGRKNVKKTLIFITDGSQSTRRLDWNIVNPAPIAKRIRESGVRIIAIGVPDKNGSIKRAELLGIAGKEKYFRTKPTFEDIMSHEFMTSIASESCER